LAVSRRRLHGTCVGLRRRRAVFARRLSSSHLKTGGLASHAQRDPVGAGAVRDIPFGPTDPYRKLDRRGAGGDLGGDGVAGDRRRNGALSTGPRSA
jgi:hypothetical protein